MHTHSTTEATDIPFGEAVRVWARVAALSFGGPAGQIAVMHRILVEEKRWISERRFLHALNYCMLLPGPEAQQLAIYIGWLMHRIRGGLVAGTLFVLPGFVALMVLSWLYVTYGNLPTVAALFVGLKAAVLAVVLQAVIRVGRRALKTRAMIAVAALAYVAIFFFAVPFPLVIVGAGAVGLIGHYARLPAFAVNGSHGDAKGPDADVGVIDAIFARGIPEHVRPSAKRALILIIVFLVLWLGPLVMLFATVGSDSVFTDIAAFFSKMAVVTFGGAYAVLAYVAQQAVEHFGWLRPSEMLDGLGMAETTPGPLVIVLQFVGFLAAYRNPGSLDPMTAAVLGGLLTTWVTFTPCFLWIFLGAPYVEALRKISALNTALSAITAAVVGVILNLAIWFALHTIFATVTANRFHGLVLQVPDPASLRLVPLLLSLGAILALFVFRIGMAWTFVGATALGLLLFLAGLA
jgi:chromate transporter